MAWVYRNTLARTAALPANASLGAVPYLATGAAHAAAAGHGAEHATSAASMAAVAAAAAAGPDPHSFVPDADDEALIDSLLFPLRDRQFANLDEFRGFFRNWLRADLQDARAGNVGSPIKAATDVLRDVRSTLQAAIEHGGLTPASHRKFLNVYHPAINRVSFGPPMRRNEELLALLDAGVIDIISGPNSTVEVDENEATYVLSTKFDNGIERRPIDALVVARLDTFFPETDESLLIRNMLKRGLIRPYYNGVFHPGGIEIDDASQPLTTDGEPSRNIWALGYPVEGCHYYTHALPRPLMRSRQVLDADRCVTAMFAQMADYSRRNAGRRVAGAAVATVATVAPASEVPHAAL
jgi:hypothetical protein